MSKMDKGHPFEAWLVRENKSFSEASAALGRSQACVSRWIRGVRQPSALDQERIATYTRGAVPVSVWHVQALAKAAAA